MGQGRPLKPSLIEHYTGKYFISKVEKGWFGKKRIRFGPSMFLSAFLFESGAVLGRVYRDRLEVLAETFANAGTEADAIAFCRALGRRHLELCDHDPNSTFHEFFLKSEFAKVGVVDPYEALLKEGLTEVPLDSSWEVAQKAMLAGIGFGAENPEMVEAMHRRTYERLPDEAERPWLKAAGIWEGPFETMTLKEREDELLGEVFDFVSMHYPNLVGPLNLRGP